MDSLAFSAFYTARQPSLVRLLINKLRSREEAEEVAQEAFNQLHNMLQKQSVQYPNALLIKIAKNLAIDRIRQNISRRKREESWSDHQQLGEPSGHKGGYPEAPQHRQLEARAQLVQVLEALDQLGPSVRQAFVLSRFHELPHREVAAKLGLSQSTVEKHIIKATRRIMQHCDPEAHQLQTNPSKTQAADNHNTPNIDSNSGDQSMTSTNKMPKQYQAGTSDG